MGKFDTISDEGIFLGYSSRSKAYRVFNLTTSTVMELANVVVDGAGPIHDDSDECDTSSPMLEMSEIK